MADIVIRRCTLRVTRHGGWSWGADRRGLVDRVTRLLPELIAARLAELLGEDDLEIVEPVRLRLELGGTLLASPAALKAAVEAAVTPECLPHASRTAIPMSSETGAEAVAGMHESAPAEGLGAPALAAPVTLRELLLRWRSQGDLPRRIRRFPAAAAELWLAALLDECEAGEGEAPPVEAVSQALRAIARRISAEPGNAIGGVRARLIAAVELAARHRRLPAGEAVLDLLDGVLPLAIDAIDQDLLPRPGKGASPAPTARGREDAGPGARPPGRVPAAPPRPGGTPQAGGEVAVASVLPFLALAMLGRIGWLDTAAAAFQALALPDRGAGFAAALAAKFLPPPELGWHHSDSALRTIAVFAGLDSAPAPAALDAWSRTAADGLGALDGFVAFEIAGGHDPALPVLATRAGEAADSPWLLFDADGLYPAAFARDEPSLLAALRPFRASILLVSRRAATPRLMRGLAGGGFAFVTDASPARGEDWPRLPGGSGCWASTGEVPPARLAAAAPRLAELEEAAAAACRELLERRPAAAPGLAQALDESATLAAALGLGLLAWTLWREREPVEPLLALQRLGDLDGSVRVTADALEVRPAVGRRYLDLKAHNLLAPVAGAPWLAGRIVRFSGP